MHYPSQTAASSRGFPDFLLRAPAASVAEPESGSTTEASESEEEEVGDEEGTPAVAEPINPIVPIGSNVGAIIQDSQTQERSTSKSHQNALGLMI